MSKFVLFTCAVVGVVQPESTDPQGCSFMDIDEKKYMLKSASYTYPVHASVEDTRGRKRTGWVVSQRAKFLASSVYLICYHDGGEGWWTVYDFEDDMWQSNPLSVGLSPGPSKFVKMAKTLWNYAGAPIKGYANSVFERVFDFAGSFGITGQVAALFGSFAGPQVSVTVSTIGVWVLCKVGKYGMNWALKKIKLHKNRCGRLANKVMDEYSGQYADEIQDLAKEYIQNAGQDAFEDVIEIPEF